MRKHSLILGTLAVLVCLLASTRANAKGDDLFTAAENGDLHRVNALLAKGADVNAKLNNGGTALMLASQNGHLEVVQALLAKGADVNAKSNIGWNALIMASQNGHLEVVQILLAKGADVNAKRDDGGTALMAASANGHLDVVQALLAKGADANAKNNNGGSPLHWAAMNDHKDVVELLLANKAEVNAKLNTGETPLHLAVANDHKDIVELLRQHGGADLTAPVTTKTTESQQKAVDGKTAGFIPVEIVVTKEINGWQKNCDGGNYAPERFTGLPAGETITGHGMSGYSIRHSNSDYIASTSISSPDGKTSVEGQLVKLTTLRVNGNPNNANGYVSAIMLSGYVSTPRVGSIGKLDLSGTTKITDNPEFNFESFKNSPFVIPFSNGYGVNIFMQAVNDDGVLTTANRYYVSDEGKPLYGRLIRSHFGKLEEIIIAP